MAASSASPAAASRAAPLDGGLQLLDLALAAQQVLRLLLDAAAVMLPPECITSARKRYQPEGRARLSA